MGGFADWGVIAAWAELLRCVMLPLTTQYPLVMEGYL